jgi:DNA-binding NarL/FixJ family response regulator
LLGTEGLSRILTSAGYRVTGRAADADALVALAIAKDADVVLIDSSLVVADESVIRRLLDGHERVVAVLVDEGQPESFVMQIMMGGATGCLSFDDPPDQFLAALELLVKGAIVVTPACTRRLFSERSPEQTVARTGQLSGREVEVARLIARGASNSEIAGELSISEHTVKIHVGNILTKLNLRNRQQVAAYVAHYGLLKDISLDPKP